MALHPSGKYLYAANETGKGSTVSAFSVEPKTGKLTLLNSLPALGEDPCHLAFDRTGKYLFVANYSSGNAVVYPILADGKLGEATASVTDKGKLGPDTKRQDGPHAHWVGPSADNRFVYVADLGLDLIFIYQFDAANGHLGVFPRRDVPPDGPLQTEPLSIQLNPGTGPRHAAISQNGLFIYVLGELKSTITFFPNPPGPIQSLPMLPAGFSGRNDAAEIEIHPSGKFLYASNRGQDSIVVYAIDQSNGKLTQVEAVPTGGKEPRHFAIDPTGKFLLAENQNSNSIVEFRIDQASGKLTPTGEVLTVPSPICLVFLPVE